MAAATSCTKSLQTRYFPSFLFLFLFQVLYFVLTDDVTTTTTMTSENAYSSPFTSRFDSNYVASDSESLEIQSLLELPTSRLEELTALLQELEEQSSKIRNEQSELPLFISKHRALISLIRKLCLKLCPLLKWLYIRKSYGMEPPPTIPVKCN